MLAYYEVINHNNETKIWTGMYQNLSNLPHWHYDIEMFKVECGDAEVFIDGKRYTMKEGDCAFIDSGEVHFIRSSPYSKLSFIIFDYKITEQITGTKKLVSPIISNENFENLYKKITDEIKNKHLFYNTMLHQILIGETIKIFRETPFAAKSPDGTDTAQRYKELLAEIDEKYSFFKYEEAASFIGFCPPYFSKYFKMMSGMTFTQYINRVRVEKAVELLRQKTDIPITEIATTCGFGTIRNFNRVFKEITGYTPKEFPDGIAVLDFRKSKIKSKSATFNPTSKESILLSE